VRQAPLLILAYNRPDKMSALINRLRSQAPPHLMIAVDGPKPGNKADATRVKAVQDAIGGIDWSPKLETRIRPSNLGLRRAVVDAVSWATSEHGKVIVIEEDVLTGPDFLPYTQHMLDRYRDDERIAHISGYNVVPASALSRPGSGSRLTVYPESIAWATWERAWTHYDDDLTWAMGCSVDDVARVTGSRASATRWKMNFRDAHADRISTWAYRWIASMWSRGALTLSPNHNLVTYAGQDEGTNSTLAPRWKELPVYEGPFEPLLNGEVEQDRKADEWVSRTVFDATPLGVVKGAAISAVLAGRKYQRARRARVR